MGKLKEKLYEKIVEKRAKIEEITKNYGDVVIDNVTVSQIFGGMRGLKCLVTDISNLDPNEGIRYRGYTLEDVFKKLPKPQGAEMPYVEGVVFLLLTGEIPTKDEVDEVVEEFQKRRTLPRYIYEIIDSFPNDCHPMTIFASAILSLHRESLFSKKYNAGIKKSEYWDSTYEDALNLLAKLPEIATYIYTKLYKKNERILSSPTLDMGANFANMLNKGDSEYADISRMNFIIHADHESGNVSAHTGHLVASTLSDIYQSISAMVNGLAGPLHGLANQEVLRWLQNVSQQMGNKEPNEEEMKKFVWETLNSGKVIPGYGHAVLRRTDPRYSLQRDFSLKYIKDDLLFKYVDMLYKVVPPILKEHGKAANPWPNIDAQSGVIQWHYGMQEYDFYTVLFGIGRAIGICANIVWDRALGFALERPKSLTTDMIEKIAKENAKK